MAKIQPRGRMTTYWKTKGTKSYLRIGERYDPNELFSVKKSVLVHACNAVNKK